jgi:tetratricopeptide (TPR) repeat protein
MARQLHKAVGQQYPSVESLTRQIRGWEKGDHFPEPHWRRGYALALAINEIDLFGVGTSVSQSQEAGEIVLSLTAEATDLAIWAEQTNVGNMTIGILSDSTRRLVADYSHQPPVPVLRNALGLYRRTRDLIRGGHQHLGQTRDLYVVAGQLLAFLSWASSDLGQPAAADTYARSGWVMAEQADHNGLRAMVLVAQSKNAFWENHLHEAADYARRGLECAPTTSRRVLLACQLGDAYQALGDLTRAREAQELAARARDAITAPDDIGGVWACGPARQANYAIWVHLRAGDIREALADAEAADRAYAEGDEWAYGTWAQIHIGTANAHLLAGRVDGAAAALSPILGMRAEERLATLSARLGEVASQLGDQRYSGSPGARSLREEITDYRANAIRTRALPSGDQ